MQPAPIQLVHSSERLTNVLAEKTPAQRLAIAHDMWVHARELIIRVLHSQHPDWTAEKIQREASRRISHGAV